jgi:hypothetical protein
MKDRYLVVAWAAALLALVVQFAHSHPAIQDKAGAAIQQELSEPFCYFLAPTDQIGFKNCPKATIVTYDGAFMSAYGQLSFYAGAPQSLRPVNKRVKTLLDDYLPVIRFGFDRDGLRYDFEAFATAVGLDPRGNRRALRLEGVDLLGFGPVLRRQLVEADLPLVAYRGEARPARDQPVLDLLLLLRADGDRLRLGRRDADHIQVDDGRPLTAPARIPRGGSA